MIRRMVRDIVDGLHSGIDVLLWGYAYPRTLPLRPHGGTLSPRRPHHVERMALLSPGRLITDPDEAEALGMTAAARRMRQRGERR